MAQPGGRSETHRCDEESDKPVGGPGPRPESARGNGAAGSVASWQI